MQTVSNAFNRRAKQSVRPVTQRVRFSFTKDYDPDVTIFTLDDSVLDGTDILGGANSVIQEWDKYTYVEYSDRVISVEWQREQATPWSLTLGIATIVLDNHDDLFTPGGGGPLQDYIKPRRPVRIYAGFGGEVVQTLIGLTEGMPKIDDKNKTATFQCIDFISYIFNNSLDETALFVDQRVDQVISSLLQTVGGLSPTQLSLDTAFTTIPYAFFDKGAKLGDVLNKLVEAELGRLYMDENGVIVFENRNNFNQSSVYLFEPSNVKDFKTKQFDELYNVVEVKSQVLDERPQEKVFDLPQPEIVPAGATVEIWANFQDPVTSVVSPVNIASATTSLWQANTASDGSGSDYTDITLNDTDLFSKSYKMTFENTGGTTAYIRSLQLHGVPVRPVKDIYVRQSVDSSVTDFEERVLTIENKYIQTPTNARSLAILIATIYSDFAGVSEMDVKGTPALQLNDTVTANVTDPGDYYISKSVNKIVGNGYEQTLQTQRRLTLSVFTLDSSELDGDDVLGL